MPSLDLKLVGQTERKPGTANQLEAFRAPLSGVIVPLEKVPDPVFSKGLAGQGIAIDPVTDEILAPCDGRVTQLHSNRHAIAIKNSSGIEILIHIGLDTVQLKGEGFQALVTLGAEVREGQPLIRFDMDGIAQKAKSLLTIVVLPQSEQYLNLQILPHSWVNARDPFFQMALSKALARSADSKTEAQFQSEWIRIQNQTGIHARPAAVLASLAKNYSSQLTLKKGKQSANIRSVTDLLGLEVTGGDQVQVEAKGDDAKLALERIVQELQTGFHEETIPAHPQPKLKSEYRGVMASPGIVIGKIFQLRKISEDIPELGQSVDQESASLKKAISDAATELKDLQKTVEKQSDPNQALIFAAHQELLEDPSLLDLAFAQIQAGKSAQFAWKQAYTEVSRRLQALNNQLLAARAADVKDIGQRVNRILQGNSEKVEYPEGSILVAEDFTPSDVASLDRKKVLGLVATTGGATSHMAILARSLEIPALVGVDSSALQISNNTLVILDSTSSVLRLQPSDQEIKALKTKQGQYESQKTQEHAAALEAAQTTDGRTLEIVANLKASAECSGALELGAEGVGLLRTEFLFLNRVEAPTEEEQFKVYSEIAQTLGKNRPFIIRTLDVGGDKPLRYLPIPREENPFLGERGIRVCLNRPEIFRTQLRAILRASAYGKVQVMFPMISTLNELQEAKKILEEERARLKTPAIPVGIMVEVPSVAILAEKFAAECDFFSIGSNDLTQYTLAVDRGHPKLASQADGLDPSLLHLIQNTVQAAHRLGKWVGVCGGIASDPQAIPILLGLKVDELSVSVPAIPAVKAQIRRMSQKECEALAQKALQASSAAEIRSWIL